MPYSDIGGNMNKARVGEPVRGSYILLTFLSKERRSELMIENSIINSGALISGFQIEIRSNSKKLNLKTRTAFDGCFSF